MSHYTARHRDNSDGESATGCAGVRGRRINQARVITGRAPLSHSGITPAGRSRFAEHRDAVFTLECADRDICAAAGDVRVWKIYRYTVR